MHARFHNPQVGRFLKVDPKPRYRSLQQPQRWNRYAYSIGNPLKYVDPDGEDIVVAAGPRKPVADAYARSATFRKLYDSLNKDRGVLVKLRLGKLVRARTKAETNVEARKTVVTESGRTDKATIIRTTIPVGAGGATIGHELFHSTELRENADITQARGAYASGSGVEGDVETRPAVEEGDKIAEELQDSGDDIELTPEQMDEIFEASDANPGCAEGTKTCPKPK
jgi:hypothetical protein